MAIFCPFSTPSEPILCLMCSFCTLQCPFHALLCALCAIFISLNTTYVPFCAHSVPLLCLSMLWDPCTPFLYPYAPILCRFCTYSKALLHPSVLLLYPFHALLYPFCVPSPSFCAPCMPLSHFLRSLTHPSIPFTFLESWSITQNLVNAFLLSNVYLLLRI